MLKYKLFEKTMKPLKTQSPATNGAYRGLEAPSPTDDPLDALARVRDELKSVSDEEEDTGQFHVSRTSVRAQGLPKWSMGLFGGAIALGLLAVAIAWAWHLAK